ncbi:4-hydroxy-3-methylbut-2-enyl diphosphate reductase, partial [Chlamydia psittaci 06-1683]|jgi:hypothetical protein
LRT